MAEKELKIIEKFNKATGRDLPLLCPTPMVNKGLPKGLVPAEEGGEMSDAETKA